jgi:hypothetical protein
MTLPCSVKGSKGRADDPCLPQAPLCGHPECGKAMTTTPRCQISLTVQGLYGKNAMKEPDLRSSQQNVADHKN